MSYTFHATVPFGEVYTGLTGTVGYQLYNADGTASGSRVTAGISELGTTGFYHVLLTLADGWVGSIQWDTGGASPIYGIEDIRGTLAAVQTHGDETWATATTVGLSDIDGVNWEVVLAAILANAVGASEVTDSVVEYKRRDGLTTVATVTMGNTAGTRTTSVLVGE